MKQLCTELQHNTALIMKRHRAPCAGAVNLSPQSRIRFGAVRPQLSPGLDLHHVAGEDWCPWDLEGLPTMLPILSRKELPCQGTTGWRRHRLVPSEPCGSPGAVASTSPAQATWELGFSRHPTWRGAARRPTKEREEPRKATSMTLRGRQRQKRWLVYPMFMFPSVLEALSVPFADNADKRHDAARTLPCTVAEARQTAGWTWP